MPGSLEIKLISSQAEHVTVVLAFAVALSIGGNGYKVVIKVLAHWNVDLRETARSWDRSGLFLPRELISP